MYDVSIHVVGYQVAVLLLEDGLQLHIYFGGGDWLGTAGNCFERCSLEEEEESVELLVLCIHTILHVRQAFFLFFSYVGALKG
jgi:hypothetical protein